MLPPPISTGSLLAKSNWEAQVTAVRVPPYGSDSGGRRGGGGSSQRPQKSVHGEGPRRMSGVSLMMTRLKTPTSRKQPGEKLEGPLGAGGWAGSEQSPGPGQHTLWGVLGPRLHCQPRPPPPQGGWTKGCE